MGAWRIANARNGQTIDATETVYHTLVGNILKQTEVVKQIAFSKSLTLANLHVNAIANTQGSPVTVRDRKNGANGAISISIPASTTGIFEDTVNSDTFVDNDLGNTQVVAAGAGGTALEIVMISYTLEDTDGNEHFMGLGEEFLFHDDSEFSMVMGENEDFSNEGVTQWTVRTAQTLSNLKVNVQQEMTVGASTCRLRLNGANANSVVTVPLDTTGQFEDTVNSDSLVAGDEINYEMISGSGHGAEGIFYDSKVIDSDVDSRLTGCADAALGELISNGETFFWNFEGGMVNRATEADVEVTSRLSFTAEDFFVNVREANTMNQATIFDFRKNRDSAALTVSVPASTTGVFEDTVNSESIVATDEFNYRVDASGSSSGSMRPTIIGFGQLTVANGGGGGAARRRASVGHMGPAR